MVPDEVGLGQSRFSDGHGAPGALFCTDSRYPPFLAAQGGKLEARAAPRAQEEDVGREDL